MGELVQLNTGRWTMDTRPTLNKNPDCCVPNHNNPFTLSFLRVFVLKHFDIFVFLMFCKLLFIAVTPVLYNYT